MTPDERQRVEAAYAGRQVCLRCGATLETYDRRCAAALGEACEGYARIENAARGDAEGRGRPF